MKIIGATRQSDGSYEIPSWLVELAEKSRGASNLGRIATIDDGVRLRGLHEARLGKCESIARTLVPENTSERPSFRMTKDAHDHGQLITSGDEISISCHGTDCTHIDGLNHFGALGTWYGGSPYLVGQESSWSIESWAQHGIITRCWLLDVPRFRGAAWVTVDEPVTGDEIQSLVDRDGIEVEAGDALLVYMGRDRFEDAGNRYLPTALAPDGRPGLAPSAGQWIGESAAAVVCWDFMDACGPELGLFGVHLLIWAVGLALVDNCHFTGVQAAFNASGRRSGCLVVSPLSVAGGTGSSVTPLVLY